MRSCLLVIAALVAGCAKPAPKVNPADFYLEVAEVATRGPRLDGQAVKVRGYVVPGSITVKGTERAFVLEQHGAQVTIRLHGPPPDTLRDRAEVVAAGTLHHEGDGWTLDADEVMAKCPDRYNKSADKGVF